MFGRLTRFLVIGVPLTLVLVSAVTASANRSASAVAVPAFSTSQLTAPSGADWLSSNGNVLSQRYSTLSQITGANGSGLKLAWSTPLALATSPGKKFAGNASPLAYNGVLYTQDAWGRVFANDGATGATLWVFDPQVAQNVPGNGTDLRGIAIGGGMVYLALAGTMYGIDAQTGAQVWANQVADPLTGQGLDAAPIYYNGMVISGTTGGDWGASCIDFALDAKTGHIKWYYNNIPSNPKAEGWNTWPAHRSYFGGGAVWDTPSIDPSLGLVYVPVGNPVPYAGFLNGPGKELNTESVLALKADTGKFAWVYQEVHHDLWDYDAMQTPVVATLKINGKNTDVVDSLNKDAYNFILNAATGKPILGAPETPVPQLASVHSYPTQPIPVGDDLIPHVPSDPQAWQGLAPDGKPYVISTQPYTPYDDQHYTVVAPTYTGGTDWYPSAADPATGTFFACVNVTDFAYESLPPSEIKPVLFSTGSFSGLKTSSSATSTRTSRLVAVNLSTNKIVWKYDTPNISCTSPVMVTGGGLVIIGRTDGTFEAHDVTNGNLVWTKQNLVAGTVQALIPRLMTYQAGGKQYIVAQTSGAVPELDAYTLP